MEFNLFRFFALLSVAFVASHAARTFEDYWRSVLPDTPMPKSISGLLQSPDQHTGKGDIVVKSENKGKPVYVGVNPVLSPFDYLYAASVNQLHSNPNVALFFLEEDLLQGADMNLHFTKSTTPTHFLPQNIADSIPFSSIKLPEILSKFSIKQNTLESETIKNTISECEAPGIKGEEKYCATSLEKMIEFTTSRLGKKVKALSTDVEKESEMQKYRILGSEKLGEKVVVCHKQNYAYAVFYCHKTNNVKAYTVFLVGNDGTKAKAAAICHTDTSSWNPKHLAFQALNVKPGTAPVCHFLPEDHLVWVPY
ncbi:BURP domain-containing protein 3 [Daucus carota subsp. sativus]|uniref:BURP domain-containing protein n=1 Tax=Daucus carota subsp. sativus TaxID=79200 RepID=A0A162BA41_DAUCS|nr:PREDICTED: BURP domain-containing protein 3-like [Daucus carota subsp. sativus]